MKFVANFDNPGLQTGRKESLVDLDAWINNPHLSTKESRIASVALSR